MANIFGAVSTKKNIEISELPFNPEVIVRKNNIAIYAGGKSLITFKDNDIYYLICGSGLNEKHELMNTADWKDYLKKGKDIGLLNGHFLLLQIQDNDIHIRNDKLGLRKLFYYDNKRTLYFSTRLDWIIPFMESPEFNHNYLLSLWNLENPIEKSCLIQDVHVIGENVEISFSSKERTFKETSWMPGTLAVNFDHATNMIENVIHSIINKTQNVYLGLSGGVDSRTLLSIFLDSNNKSWSTHTFGQKTHFDIHIANSLAKLYKLNHYYHDISPYKNDEIFGTWQDFVLETNCLLPAYSYHELSYYKILPSKGFFIDGGKGEFIRRGLSNRLAILGKKALNNKNITAIKTFLSTCKPDIFNNDLKQNSNDILYNQVSTMIENMPSSQEFGVENWVDLYNIRYRTGNSGYVGQARLDGIIKNIMPFIQPMLLEIVLNLPARSRQNEIINRKLLNRHFRLKLFPFARYKTIIPYQHNKYSSLLWSKLMKLVIKEKADVLKQFINLNKEYILSRISDTGFLNSSLYNSDKIKKTALDYFNGKNDDIAFLIWWMTFDVWHQLIYD